jgi:hypothetical protein
MHQRPPGTRDWRTSGANSGWKSSAAAVEASGTTECRLANDGGEAPTEVDVRDEDEGAGARDTGTEEDVALDEDKEEEEEEEVLCDGRDSGDADDDKTPTDTEALMDDTATSKVF